MKSMEYRNVYTDTQTHIHSSLSDVMTTKATTIITKTAVGTAEAAAVATAMKVTKAKPY